MVPVSRSTTGAGFPSVSSPSSATISNSVQVFPLSKLRLRTTSISSISLPKCVLAFTECKQSTLLRGDQGRDTIRVVPAFPPPPCLYKIVCVNSDSAAFLA